MKPTIFLAPIWLALSVSAMAQGAGPLQQAPQAPSSIEPVEQAAPAGSAGAADPSQQQQTMQPQAPVVQVRPLPANCTPATALAGSEQSMSATDMSSLEHLGPGNDALLSALSAIQVQMKSAVAQENIDLGYACAVLALYNGLDALTAVQREHGTDATVRQGAERVLQQSQGDVQSLEAWVGQQQPTQ